MFALEWVQRFKDRIAARSSSTRRSSATASQRRGADALGRRGVLAAAPGPGRERRVGSSCSTSPTRVLDEAAERRRQAVHRDPGRPASRSTRSTTSRARSKFFAIAAGDRAAEPERAGLRRCRRPRRRARASRSAAGSMPTMAAADAAAAEPQRQAPRLRRRRAKAAERAGAEACGRAKAAEARKPPPRQRRAGCRRGRRRCSAAAPRPRRRAAADNAAAAKAAADEAAPMRRRPSPGGSRRRDGGTRRPPRVAPTRASLAWKDVVAKFPPARAPRRELARVLRKAQSWAQLADALKDEEAKAAPTRRRQGERVRSSSPRPTASSTTTTR